MVLCGKLKTYQIEEGSVLIFTSAENGMNIYETGIIKGLIHNIGSEAYYKYL